MFDLFGIQFTSGQHNTQAKHSCHNEFMLFEQSSSGEVVGLVCDRVCQLDHSLVQRTGRQFFDIIILRFVGFSVLTFCLAFSFAFCLGVFLVLTFFTFFCLFIGWFDCLLILTDQIDGAIDHSNERLQTIHVEGVNLVQRSHQEENQGASSSYGTVSLAGLVDLGGSFLGNFNLFFDFHRDLLGVFQIFDQFYVLQNLILICRCQLVKQSIF
mmetsp:Transcript_24746/g.28238  ORF Transcript_24746/g.28238 Transcript_24746/m.28238 type:complete len:212 (+) Transcript_24746:558-1193(+)